MKISFLAAVISPVKFFILTHTLYTQLMLILILNDVQYLQNTVFTFEKTKISISMKVK